MARKNIGKILSDGAVVLCVVLFCALNISVQADIPGQRITYTISGSVGQPGVTMSGLPDTVTDQNGYYSAVVDYNWSGTVKPILPGFTFEPEQITYQNVTSNKTNQDYIAKIKTYTISGLVSVDGKPMAGVEMDGLPGTPVTSSNGTYVAIVDYGFTGSAAPTKEGYIFTPGSKPYTSVNRDMPNQNFTGTMVTFTISGSTQIEGATLKGLPDNPKSGANGAYSATVPFNWTGTVKPEKEGYTFEPAEIPYTNIISSYPNQDYFANAITFTISGSAALDGVEMTGLPGPAVFTDGNGYYSATVNWGWSGSVKPIKAGFKFEPATMNYTKLMTEKTNQNYTPSPIMLTISGSAGVDGATMQGLPGNPVTGPGGSYSATVDWGFSNIVIPIKEGYEFTPAETTYAAITNDQKTNYTAKEIILTISGSAGIGGVKLSGLLGRPIMSNPDGTYSAEVKYGWNGTIKPEKAGYTFEPEEITYPALYGNEANRDYIAILEKRTISGTIKTDKGEPVEGVFVLARDEHDEGGSATTNANGEYEITVNYGWRGTVTPTLQGHNFRPTNKRYVVPVTREQSNQHFSAIVQMFTITDTVTVGGTGIEGVKVTANNGGGTAVTDAKGEFNVQVPYNWTGEIELERPGFIFNSKTYTTNITEDWKNDMPVSSIPDIRRPTPTPTPEPTAPTPEQPTVTVPRGEQWPGGIPPRVPTPTPETVPEPTTPLTPLEQIQKQLDELLKQRQPTAVPEPNEILPQQPLISNTFLEEQIIDVLQTIAAAADVTIIPDETVLGSVTCTLENVPVETALDIVLGGTPYIWKKTPYYYLVASGGVTDAMFPRLSETRRLTMNYVTAEAAVGLLSTAFKPYVQAEVGPPGTDTYTVTVTAPPALMERIIADLKQIDKIRQQVLLDARIVTMERGNLLNLGVSWTWPTINAGLFGNDLQNRAGGLGLLDFGGKVASGFQIGYTPDSTFTDALTATLNLLASNDEATIIANPQVLAQDGKTADISVISEEYFFMSGGEGPAGMGFYGYYAELQKIESGTKLNITPHIGDNNEITLALVIEVSDSIPRGRESELPVVNRRTSTNTVRIKDGGTVALAGLTENRTRTDKRRVPGLSKLPIIGGLFKNTNDEAASREIAVFVTAHLIPERGRSIDFFEPSTPSSIQEPGRQGSFGQGSIGQAQMQQPTRVQVPTQPMENDFRASLRRSLARPLR